MAIVIDANLVIVVVGNDPRSRIAEARIDEWARNGEDLHAPSLLPYEVASGLTRIVRAGGLPSEQLLPAWQSVLDLPITYHPLDVSGLSVVNIALQLQRSSAYDAAYLALAQELDAEFWTLDGPLARNASSLGFAVNLL